MVHEAYRFALPPALLGSLALAAGWNWLGIALLGVASFVLFFFRDPARQIPDDAKAIVAPADGRVMEIVEEVEQGRPGRRMSIFLSIFDVHVNRVPYAGRIVRIQYRSGKFLNAMREQASAVNEQNIVTLETARGPVVVRQIAGFGSRVDLWLPADASFTVRPGEHVRGGATIVARWD
jgi:phosphatidylserine decarboxylase